MNRTFLTITVALGALLLLGTPASAVPPCSWSGTYDACNQYCYFGDGSTCTNVTVQNCKWYYTCSSGHQFSGPCDCGSEPPPPPPGGCFLAGTPITMADGSTKPIEEIAVGDVVLAYDKKSGEMKPDPVKRLHKPVTVDSYLLVNGDLRITPTQPVFSAGKWVEMGQLKVGDTLTAANGHPLPIETLEVVRGPITVYNFDTNPYETFVAGGIIVHRKQDIEQLP
jgi:pretoxin HINT domain-containing protein